MICPHCGKDTEVKPPKVKKGDKVRHKKKKWCGVGVVIEISNSGAKAYVSWRSPTGRYAYPFTAYYYLDALEVVDEEDQ